MDVGAVLGKGKGSGEKGKTYAYKGKGKGKSKQKGQSQDDPMGVYPNGEKGSKKGSQKKAERIEGYCLNCGKWGHPARSCWAKAVSGVESQAGSSIGPSASVQQSQPTAGSVSAAFPTEGVIEEEGPGWVCSVTGNDPEENGDNIFDDIFIDSGSVASCCPRSFAPEIPIDERIKVQLCDVQGTPLRTYGTKEAKFDMQNNTPSLTMNFDVSDVKKLIGSAANMVDAGIELHYTKDACWAEKEAFEQMMRPFDADLEEQMDEDEKRVDLPGDCLLYTSPSPRDS